MKEVVLDLWIERLELLRDLSALNTEQTDYENELNLLAERYLKDEKSLRRLMLMSNRERAQVKEEIETNSILLLCLTGE